MNTSPERSRRRRDKLRDAGLRSVQIWVPDTSAPGFAAKCRHRCESIAAAEKTAAARTEIEFWERATADAWNDLN
jgi:hypothetical protein